MGAAANAAAPANVPVVTSRVATGDGYHPASPATATTRYCGLLTEMSEDCPASSWYGKPYCRPLMSGIFTFSAQDPSERVLSWVFLNGTALRVQAVPAEQAAAVNRGLTRPAAGMRRSFRIVDLVRN